VRVLLLGGTAEARDLAHRLAALDVEVVSSLAGRVARPRLPVGEVRVGGFAWAGALRRVALPRNGSVTRLDRPSPTPGEQGRPRDG